MYSMTNELTKLKLNCGDLSDIVIDFGDTELDFSFSSTNSQGKIFGIKCSIGYETLILSKAPTIKEKLNKCHQIMKNSAYNI